MSKVKLAFVGDIALHGAPMNQTPPCMAFTAVSDVLAQFDRVIANLECVLIVNPDVNDRKRGCLVTGTEKLGFLETGVSWMLNVANNHIMDGGVVGLRQTLYALDAAGFAYYGAGINQSVASAPLRVMINGIRVILVGAADFHYANATETTAGANRLRSRELIKRVKLLASECDLLIVTMHADLEFVDHPAPYRRRLAKQIIDAGAHIIVQHHPHVIQGAEYYRGGFIAYSLGNFLFKIGDYQGACEEVARSAILGVTISVTEVGCTIDQANWIPIGLDENGFPRIASELDCGRMQSRIKRLSAELHDNRLQRLHWLRVSGLEVRRLAMELYYLSRKNGIRKMLRRMLSLSRENLVRRCVIGIMTFGWR